MSVVELLSFENEVFKTYVFWAGVLTLKMLGMAILTGKARHANKAFANPEDAAKFNTTVKHDDPDVERVRRAHRNDLENVLPLLIIGFLYVLINPTQWLAIFLFRAAAIARIVHSFVYAVWVLPPPSRGIGFGVPFLISGFMALQVICHACC